MRDIAVIIILAGCIWLAFRHAWWGVLSLAVFSYMNPHAYAWGFAQTLPAFQILFLVVAFKTFQTQDRQSLPKDWRIPAFITLWIYFLLTTTFAVYQAPAWEKFWFVSKIYIPLLFTLILINTRQKLYYLIITIAASFALVADKGGIFAIAKGFSHRVYGPPGTQFYENNAFAVATLICVPLLVLWYRETSHKLIRYGIALSIPLCIASALSSWSRGGLLALGVLAIIFTWHSKRKYLVLPLLVIGAFIAAQNLPDAWFARMQTIETYQEDSSAMQRMEAWQDGWQYALSHPLTGAGFDGWRYVTMRDWHNSYVEMFAEHGFIAFGIWLSLILGTIVSLTTLPREVRGIPGMEWVKNYCYMIRASIFVYMAGTMFLGLSYWDILYHLIFISVLIKKFAMEELAEHRAQGKKSISFYQQNEPGVAEPDVTNPTR